MTNEYSLPGVSVAVTHRDQERINRFKAKRMAEETEAVWASDFERVKSFLSGRAYRFPKAPGGHYSHEHPEESRTTHELETSWFNGLQSDATESGNSMPSQSVVDETKRIVIGLRPHLPATTDVYTMEGGEIAVEVFGKQGRGFLLVCEPAGGALCAITIDNVSRRARYESSNTLPDGFLREGLQAVMWQF